MNKNEYTSNTESQEYPPQSDLDVDSFIRQNNIEFRESE